MVLERFRHTVDYLGLRLGRSQSYLELCSDIDENFLRFFHRPEKDCFPGRFDKFEQGFPVQTSNCVPSFTRARRVKAIITVPIKLLNCDWCII